MFVSKKKYDDLAHRHEALQKLYDDLTAGLTKLCEDPSHIVFYPDCMLLSRQVWQQVIDSITKDDTIIESLHAQIRDLKAEREYYRLKCGELLATTTSAPDEADKASMT